MLVELRDPLQIFERFFHINEFYNIISLKRSNTIYPKGFFSSDFS